MNNHHKWLAATAERLAAPDTQAALMFIRAFVATLPGSSEQLCYGTPGFYVGKKYFSRLREDGKTLVIHTREREKWFEKDPETYFVTDHYRSYDYMLVNLDTVDPEELKSLILTAWRNRAAAKLVREYDAR